MTFDATLLQAATGCTPERAALYAEPLGQACDRFGINTPARLAAFLAQLGHESASLRYVREVWGPTPAQQRYEGRRDLGNVNNGDGARYLGRGLIQTTGRANYAAERDRLRAIFGADVPDFEADPEALEQPRWACLSAAEYWASHRCNELADAGAFEAITRKINGGLNGQADRLARWERAKRALSVDQPQAGPASQVITPAPVQAPESEKPMLPALLIGLAQSLFTSFKPLVDEKIQKEIGRHTDNPEVSQQIAASLLDKAAELTGKTDPVEAVVAAKADPQIIQQLEDHTLDHLEKMAPLFDKLAANDAQTWATERADQDAAAVRARGDAFDMTPWLMGGALAALLLMIALVGFIVVYQVIYSQDHSADTAAWAALTGLIGFITGAMVSAIYSYRFATTRNSSANQAVMAELARRPTQGTP